MLQSRLSSGLIGIYSDMSRRIDSFQVYEQMNQTAKHVSASTFVEVEEKMQQLVSK